MSDKKQLDERYTSLFNAHEKLKEAHNNCTMRIARAEAETEREQNMRRVQLKSAKEVRRRLESMNTALEIKVQSLLKGKGAAEAEAKAVAKLKWKESDIDEGDEVQEKKSDRRKR